ncbi:MAG: cyclodeaminase/cyclohydrolase family protein [Chloroflexi bacterium]|nr:cyclodeaminase/cyclohydrolase family protein [Chloroflexota bacterium]
MSDDLAGTSVGVYLDDLASDRPAPGGGSAAAVCGALGAALVSMVCRLTLNDTGYAAVHGELRSLLAQSETLRARFLTLAADDARVAGGMVVLVHALRSAPADAAGPLRAKLQIALQAAAGASLAILQACAAALDMSETAVRLGAAVALSDVGTAAAVAAAGAEGAALTVAINLALIADQDFVRQTRASVDALNVEVARRHTQIIAEVKNIL